MNGEPIALPVAEIEQDMKDNMLAITQAKQSGQSLDAAVDELERELAVRDRCYERWIKDGKISKTTARDQYQRLKAAIAFLSAYRTLGKGQMPVDPEEAKQADDVPF